ncbi:MAG TPA: NDP-sugar synthase, partial [Acidimicrobiales bacterium]|nr:NDP-sugar synthase [Acidimicrobiales bacterium]
VKAVVLVGGTGTRLRPLTLTVPKQVLPIVEVPMIERVLTYLESHGVDEVVLSLGYLSDAFEALFPEGTAGGVRLTYAVEPEPLDTAGAVRFAARYAGIDERFLVVNGDILTDLDVSAMVAFHVGRKAEASISLAKVADPSAFGLVPIDGEGKVVAFVEKPAPGAVGPSLINAGTYVLEPSVLDRIPGGRRVSIEREVFPVLATAGRLYGFHSTDYWTDTGTPLQYLEAQLALISGRRPGPPAPGATAGPDGVWTVGRGKVGLGVHGPSFLGEGAWVAADASVEGSVVGAGCRIHPGARVVDSVLLSHGVVGEGALVSRSILGRGVRVGGDAEVTGVSVLGDGYVVDPGARLEGARLPAS